MGNFENLKASIAAVIKENGNQEITGPLLQSTLLSIVSNVGKHSSFVGLATPSTQPGTPDGNVFYLANPGKYPNFNAATVEEGELGIFNWVAGDWSILKLKVGSGVAGATKVDIATPSTTKPNQDVTYLAFEEGYYNDFDGNEVVDGEFVVFKYNKERDSWEEFYSSVNSILRAYTVTVPSPGLSYLLLDKGSYTNFNLSVEANEIAVASYSPSERIWKKELSVKSGGGVASASVDVAVPTTSAPNQEITYLAFSQGTYTNFNAIVLAENEFAILQYKVNTWVKAYSITAGGGGSQITVDDHLNPDSTNPVQNKIISKKLSELGTDILRDMFIQPVTGDKNLYLFDSKIFLLSPFSDDKTIRLYDKLKDGNWASTQLIPVEPNTQYTASECQGVLEWDNNLKNLSTTNTSGTHTFTTSEKTRYVSFKLYISNGNPSTSLKHFVKGNSIADTSIFREKSLPPISDFNGHKRTFVPSIANDAINLSMLRENCLMPSAMYYIQPPTNKSNLIYADNDVLLLSLFGDDKTIRLYDKAIDGVWATTQLISVEPNTQYTASEWSTIAFWDKNLSYIDRIESDTGYKEASFQTPDNARYISFTSYVSNNIGDAKVKYLEKGDKITSRIINHITELPDIDSLFGHKRTFNVSPRGVLPNKWSGKRLLVIGDSVSADFVSGWQYTVGSLLNMKIRNHSKGGIGILQMVDGDSEMTPPDYDPDNFGVEHIYPLNVKDVTDVDLIILMGFYNERGYPVGNQSDMHPTNNTVCGRLNYAVKRVYEELEKAKNYKCKIVICSAHKYGKYGWVDKTAYEDGRDLLDAAQKAANYNSLPLINLMDNGGINKYNWKVYQSSETPYSADYIPADGVNNGTNKPFARLEDAPSAAENLGKYITVQEVENSYVSDGHSWVKDRKPYPWNADQLHLGKGGHALVGEYIAGFLSTL